MNIEQNYGFASWYDSKGNLNKTRAWFVRISDPGKLFMSFPCARKQTKNDLLRLRRKLRKWNNNKCKGQKYMHELFGSDFPYDPF